mmetsp:Transcript_29550/g.69438  ORF Transcript_29550/g.69438 Transcript_29550/m.69438 type:complete len:283 (+) Transcript_29550:207-1055(+)
MRLECDGAMNYDWPLRFKAQLNDFWSPYSVDLDTQVLNITIMTAAVSGLRFVAFVGHRGCQMIHRTEEHPEHGTTSVLFQMEHFGFCPYAQDFAAVDGYDGRTRVSLVLLNDMGDIQKIFMGSIKTGSQLAGVAWKLDEPESVACVLEHLKACNSGDGAMISYSRNLRVGAEWRLTVDGPMLTGNELLRVYSVGPRRRAVSMVWEGAVFVANLSVPVMGTYKLFLCLPGHCTPLLLPHPSRRSRLLHIVERCWRGGGARGRTVSGGSRSVCQGAMPFAVSRT